MYILTVNNAPIGQPCKLKEVAGKIQLLKHSVANIGYQEWSEPQENDDADLPITQTHWVYTEEGADRLCNQSQASDKDIYAGAPIDWFGAKHCPEEWILNGWVKEANAKEHQIYNKSLDSKWDRTRSLCC